MEKDKGLYFSDEQFGQDVLFENNNNGSSKHDSYDGRTVEKIVTDYKTLKDSLNGNSSTLDRNTSPNDKKLTLEKRIADNMGLLPTAIERNVYDLVYKATLGNISLYDTKIKKHIGKLSGLAEKIGKEVDSYEKTLQGKYDYYEAKREGKTVKQNEKGLKFLLKENEQAGHNLAMLYKQTNDGLNELVNERTAMEQEISLYQRSDDPNARVKINTLNTQLSRILEDEEILFEKKIEMEYDLQDIDADYDYLQGEVINTQNHIEDGKFTLRTAKLRIKQLERNVGKKNSYLGVLKLYDSLEKLNQESKQIGQVQPLIDEFTQPKRDSIATYRQHRAEEIQQNRTERDEQHSIKRHESKIEMSRILDRYNVKI